MVKLELLFFLDSRKNQVLLLIVNIFKFVSKVVKPQTITFAFDCRDRRPGPRKYLLFYQLTILFLEGVVMLVNLNLQVFDIEQLWFKRQTAWSAHKPQFVVLGFYPFFWSTVDIFMWL